MRRPIEILTKDEVIGLMRACGRQRYPTCARNRAMVALMYGCGLRVSELLALKPRDINKKEHYINVRHGKGDKQRMVGLDDHTILFLEKWEVHRRWISDAENAKMYFCTLKGKPIDRRYLGQLLNKLGRKAKIDKRIHPHGLRHTHAAQLAKEGTPITVISKQLGHYNIYVTHRYIDHISPQEVIDVVRKRNPYSK